MLFCRCRCTMSICQVDSCAQNATGNLPSCTRTSRGSFPISTSQSFLGNGPSPCQNSSWMLAVEAWRNILSGVCWIWKAWTLRLFGSKSTLAPIPYKMNLFIWFTLTSLFLSVHLCLCFCSLLCAGGWREWHHAGVSVWIRWGMYLTFYLWFWLYSRFIPVSVFFPVSEPRKVLSSSG